MIIPTIYHIYELYEEDPDDTRTFHCGYYITKKAMEAKLNYLNHTNIYSYISYHVSELQFMDADGEEDLPEFTQQTIH